MDSGSTAFIIICAALVFIMTPGLGFFYGGLGRRKNVVSNMMNSVFIMGLGMVLWTLVGYTMSFGGDAGDKGGLIIGGFNHLGLAGITGDTLDFNGMTNQPIPAFVFCAFQMMFSIITPAIITGSLSGRMKFKALFFFIALWSIVVYYPMAHMVWGNNGILGADHLGSLDFAGGNVVHIASGVSGLVLCLMLGKRNGYEHQAYRTHNIPFVMLGMGLLWLGWFGFNAGSALEANGLAAHAFMTTAVSASTALLSWMFIDAIVGKKTTLIGASTGAVAGLVGITPGAGFVPIWAALVIGALVSPICYFGIVLIKKKLKLDDALDAFGCHGIGGIFGGLMTGLCAQAVVGGTDGLFYGNAALVGKQAVAILVSIAVAAIGTFICASIVKLFTPLRVTKKNELMGLDVSEHGENAYPSYMGLD
ncbi:MAG: ammonium transporter [Acidobacteriota bacterium]|jgi:Amt family ammonium transporter|nr:ammonium transporter [Acidobacteriota bacterium]